MPRDFTFNLAQTLLCFLVNLLQLVQTLVKLCPELFNLLQHQTALAGTLLHNTCWAEKYIHAGCTEEQRASDRLCAHSPLPGLASGVVCPGLFQEKVAKAGYSKHSNTKAGRENKETQRHHILGITWMLYCWTSGFGCLPISPLMLILCKDANMMC